MDSLLGNLLLKIAPVLLFFSKKKDPRPGEAPKKILLVKFHGIGNIVMILPALRAIKRKFPYSRIDFLTLDTNKSILSGAKNVEKAYYFESETIPVFLWSFLVTMPKLRRERYDAIIDFEQFANISTLIASALGAPRRIGFKAHGPDRTRIYTTAVDYVEDAHMWRIFMRLAEAVGASAEPVEREIDCTPEQEGQARKLLADFGVKPEEPLFLMHPGSSSNLTIRRWPPDRFAALTRLVSERFGAKVILTGVPNEAEITSQVVSLSGGAALDSTGKLSLKGLAALCKMAEFVVSNDTATVHVASAMGTPVIGLFGPNTPFLYGPVGEDDLVFYNKQECSPCLTNTNRKLSDCKNPKCMLSIGVNDVFGAIENKYFDNEGKILPAFKKNRQ